MPGSCHCSPSRPAARAAAERGHPPLRGRPRHSGYLYGKLGPTGELAGGLRTLSTGETAERADRVPLTADRSGDTFVAFANGLGAVRAAPAARLTVQATSQGVRVLDDGFPVPGATARAGGKTAKTGASGVASLGTPPHHTAVAVSAPGYAPGSAVSP